MADEMNHKTIQVGTIDQREVLRALMDTADGAVAIDPHGRVLLFTYLQRIEDFLRLPGSPTKRLKFSLHGIE